MNITKSKGYWLKKIQVELYNELLDYIEANNLTQNDLAQKLNVSKGYISQLLNGKFDHKVSKLVDLAFLMDKFPVINYPKQEKYIEQERNGIMLPYKFFHYDAIRSPIEKSVSDKFRIDLSFSQNKKVDLETNEYVTQY